MTYASTTKEIFSSEKDKEKSLRVALLANKKFTEVLLGKGLHISTSLEVETDPVTKGWRWAFVLYVTQEIYEASSDIDFNYLLTDSTINAMAELDSYPPLVSVLEVRAA